MEVIDNKNENAGFRITEDEEMLARIAELQSKLEMKNFALSKTRLKLARAKEDIKRLKGIVNYQRDRIIKLHNRKVNEL